MKSFFSYFGSKVRLAKHYPAPAHNFIIEPFAGAAGYSLRYPHHNIILFDTDPCIVGIWKYLISATPSEILSLPLAGDTLDDFHVCPEAKDLIGFWFGRSSTHPRTKRSSWSHSNLSSGWNENIRHRIASQVELIKHWRIYNRSYVSVPDFYATWFIDPPYTKEGHKYRHHSIDYGHLGQWCQARQGQVIVCESEGADWLPFVPLGDYRATTKRVHEIVYYK